MHLNFADDEDDSKKPKDLEIAISETKSNQINSEREIHIKKQIHDLVAFETAIAKITKTPAERRQDSKTYHNSTLNQLNEIADFLRWTAYFNDAFFFHLKKPLEDQYQDVTYAEEYIRKSFF